MNIYQQIISTMTTRLKSVIFVMALFLTNSVFAQSSATNSSAINPKTAQYALEVYQDITEYQTPEHLANYNQFLSQVTVTDMGASASTYPLLQTVGLKDKYNPSLTIDQAGFDPSNFNALKYHFNFYENGIQRFRVSGTNYVVTISPPSNL